jgi:hypothetical protein
MVDVRNPPAGVMPEETRDNGIKANNRRASFSEEGGHKVFLPRQSGQPRFGPQPFYYEASKSGVVPSWTATTDEGALPPAADPH